MEHTLAITIGRNLVQPVAKNGSAIDGYVLF
jgi:hypothetical protein